MIDLYTWSTPNGRKVSIMLEECGLEYAAHPVDISKDEQFKADFLKISPNNRIPAIVDRDNGRSLFESGAILMYLAEKTGKFWPKDPAAHWQTVEWLMWQMGGIGPMIGQVHHFLRNAKGKAPVRGGALRQGSASALRCARQATRPGRVHGRHVLDCRHGDLALDLAFRVAHRRSQQIFKCAPMVQGDRGPTRGRQGLSCSSEAARHSNAGLRIRKSSIS